MAWIEDSAKGVLLVRCLACFIFRFGHGPQIVLGLKNGAPHFSCFGRKDFLPVEPPPQADLSFLFLLGRTQVRLIPLLH
jgi:hypothetical protein